MFVQQRQNNKPKGDPMKRSLMIGIDLHSNNLFCGIVDAHGRRVYDKKLPCQLPIVLEALKPFKNRIDTIAVESTYNWYWLVEGLQDNGYKVVLANPAQMEQYNGLKHTDDKSDAFFLAEMLRLKILPTGYICDRKLRPVRDLLRRRMGLVQKRTSLLLSLGSLYTRMTGQQMPQRQLKALDRDDVTRLFDNSCDQLITEVQLKLLEQLDESIKQVERTVLKHSRKMRTYQVLQTIPGIGTILGMTISLETVDPKRFATAGDYASYCRCVDSRRVSNGKKKGENNRKCGNRYLAWAFVEAANFAKRYDAQCRRFYDRKSAQTNSIVATKALGCKLAKAAWHMMRENTQYDAARIFPARPQLDFRERLKSQVQVLAKSPQD
ncbi:MAG: IS110 family RNA-guided transposase [Limisphaerales bacterium]